jgi:hypothetical protein
MSYMSSPSPQRLIMAHTIIINVACHQGYHHHHDVVSIMAETHQAISTISCHQDKTSSCHLHARNSSSSNHHCHQRIMTRRHHQVISSKAPPSLSSRDQAIIKCINWTMGSTIKCNGSKPSARATSSINHHQGIHLHHLGSTTSSGSSWDNISSSCLQASICLHRTVTTARVTIR